MARKMFEKAGLIPGLQVLTKPVGEAGQPAAPPKARTAPGTMMDFLTSQSSAVQEADVLRARVKSLEEQAPLQKLHPSLIKPSRWANRHESAFQRPDFAELKAEIEAAGGNVQPIKVRPLPLAAGTVPTTNLVLNRSTPDPAPSYELIFGHRRHRACLELGLPVLATIEEATDTSLFEQMERENRGRKNLSAWEQGTMYRRALDDGLYPSLRRLAESLGVDVSAVSKSVSLARLPDAVVAAFPSPLDIQFRWAAPLAEAMQKDPEGTMARAKALSESRGSLNAAAVYATVIGAQAEAAAPAVQAELPIAKAGKTVGKLTADSKGRARVSFEAGVLPASKHKALIRLIEELLKG